MIYLDDVRSGSDCRVLIANVEIQEDDLTTHLATAADVTVYSQVFDADGTQVLTPTQAAPQPESLLVPPASWVGRIPAESLVYGKSPWRFRFLFYGPAGLSDVLLHSESTIVLDSNR